MAVNLGSTFKELIDEINSKGSGAAIDSINGLKGGTLKSPITFKGGDQATASKAILDQNNQGQVTDTSTATLLGFNSAKDFLVGSNSYKTVIRGNSNSTIGDKKISDLALVSDIVAKLVDYVKLTGDQTIGGVKTFNAPTNVSGTEQATSKFKTANGGAIILGKEGSNSGTMIRLDQTDGTCRLRFRASSVAGAMVWEQPEKGAALYVDLGSRATGGDYHRIQFPSKAGTLALTNQLPAVVSANPTLSGSETELTGLKIGGTSYKVPSGGSGGTEVVPNGSILSSPIVLNSLNIDGKTYRINTITPNIDTAGVTPTKLDNFAQGGTVYEIPKIYKHVLFMLVSSTTNIRLRFALYSTSKTPITFESISVNTTPLIGMIAAAEELKSSSSPTKSYFAYISNAVNKNDSLSIPAYISLAVPNESSGFTTRMMTSILSTNFSDTVYEV